VTKHGVDEYPLMLVRWCVEKASKMIRDSRRYARWLLSPVGGAEVWKALDVVKHMGWLAGRGLGAIDRCERVEDSGSLSVGDRQVLPGRYQTTP
jgi:hypothetical protein